MTYSVSYESSSNINRQQIMNLIKKGSYKTLSEHMATNMEDTDPFLLNRFNHFISSISSELDDILKECSEHNWDGYDGQPVSKDSCDNVMLFVKSNIEHLSLTKPELVPNSHGLIDMEWWSEDKHIALALTFHTNSMISFGFVNKGTKKEQENSGSFELTRKISNGTILSYLDFFKTKPNIRIYTTFGY